MYNKEMNATYSHVVKEYKMQRVRRKANMKTESWLDDELALNFP